KGGFQFVQEMTGLVSPGVFSAFFMGFFWKRTNSAGALFAIVVGFIIALLMHFNLFPGTDWSAIPFLDRMGWVFLICVIGIVILGYALPQEHKGLEIDISMFKVSRTFAIGTAIVFALIIILYATFW